MTATSSSGTVESAGVIGIGPSAPFPLPAPIAFTAVTLSVDEGERPGLAVREKAMPNDDPFEEVARGLKVTLGRNRPGEVVDRPKRLEACVAIEIAHPAHDALLKQPCFGELALSCHCDGQLADRLQCSEVALA